ncbi:DUF1304 domain-containing protein [Streptomyces atacamensis]|uniref:DUF1304 domain-containing protein n=1 Tax=Streptomyces atacamensis TaxID=531966 RepID=UPI00399D2423
MPETPPGDPRADPAPVRSGAVVLPGPAGREPEFWSFLTGSTADAPEVRLWRVNVGFYNLFLALGLIAGVVSLHTGDVDTGRSLIVYVCVFMIAAGTVLFVSDRRLWRGSLGQAVPPDIALAAHALLD